MNAQPATTTDPAAPDRHVKSPAKPGRVLVSGASGLVGGALVPALKRDGWEVLRLVRRAPRDGSEVGWEPEAGRVDFGDAGEIDAVVHLAGAGIADGRWTRARKHVIRESRVRGTRGLAEALAARPRPPRVVVGGSAVGYYGDTGDGWVDEGSPAGTGFLAEVCREWEAAWAPLEAGRVAGAGEAATRLVFLRTGLVLAAEGGALAKLLTPFRLGLGGRVGDGRQWWSWISREDLVGAVRHALADGRVRGPMNAVAPEPVTNAEFARVLGKVLRRPALLPAPAWALRAALGAGLADELLLASQRVRAGVLGASGFRYRHENLETALRRVLAEL